MMSISKEDNGCSGVWKQEGFEDFIQGSFGNAGQNIRVSRAGVIQRVHQFDIDGDGYVDLVFCNSHDAIECPPAYVYHDPLGSKSRSELPARGVRDAVVTDLNGDGYDDLVLAMWFDGITSDQNAIVYYGSPEGWSERKTLLLPAPQCRSVTAGDFNGDGKLDLAFLSLGSVRIFYQSDLGFETTSVVELTLGSSSADHSLTKVEVTAEGMRKLPEFPPDRPVQLSCRDLDGDGCGDLIVRLRNGETRIYWGGTDGVNAGRFSVVPVEVGGPNPVESQPPKWAGNLCPDPEKWAFFYEWAAYFEGWNGPNGQLPTARTGAVSLRGQPHAFAARPECAYLVPVKSDRTFGEPIAFKCKQPMAVAVGDVNGDGYEDVVLACQEERGEGECSWIYWGGKDGFSESGRTSLETFRAHDVALADLNENGCDDIVFGQSFTMESWTTDSLIYAGCPSGIAEEPVKLLGHNVSRVQVARPSSNSNQVIVLANRTEGVRTGKALPAYLYFGGKDGFSPDNRVDMPNWGAADAACCDVNDDGRTDIVLANAWESSYETSNVYVLLNGHEGLPKKPSLELSSPAYGVCCADLNHNGHLDIVAINSSGNEPELRIFHGTDDGIDKSNPTRILMQYEGVTYADPLYGLLADFNNDGWLDLFVPQREGNRVFILWGGPDGFSMQRCQALFVKGPAAGQAADLNGNGYLDLIVGGDIPRRTGPHDSFVHIFWNGPEGLRQDNCTMLPSNCVTGISVADFNNDGMLDIFICNYWGVSERDIPSYIYWNRKGRGFTAFDRTDLLTHSASGCIAADFNEDGWVDIAVAYHKVNGRHVGDSAVWWNGPDGFNEENVTLLPTRGPHGMVWVDPGNIMDRGEEEYYTSKAHRLPKGSKVSTIEWEAELQVKTWVKAQLRFAETMEGLDSAPWQGPEGIGSWFENGDRADRLSQSGLWIQYRLALEAKNSGNTPRVTSVSVYYA